MRIQVRNARAVKQKVWNEAENRERDLRARARPGESLVSQALRTCEARALRERKTLTARFTELAAAYLQNKERNKEKITTTTNLFKRQ